MKIYTRTGDDGTTALFGAGRVPKYHLRIESYGTVDETNSVLGMVLAQLSIEAEAIRPLLIQIQNDLFVVGGDLASPEETTYPVPRIQETHILALEKAIDNLEQELSPLKNFILPSGHLAATTIHLARTVCRRAERNVVALAHSEAVNPNASPYLNRLSDLLFVMARWVNLKTNTQEMEWKIT